MAVENVFNFYSSDSYQQVGNCLYPYHFIVKSAEDFKEMASHDHVCVRYKNNYRGTENFVESNVHQYDVDNHHSDNPDAWITDKQLHLAFEGVPHIISRSRNYMKQKGNYSPRPRYHIAVIGERETSPEEYVKFNARVLKQFPYFDAQALDAGRFFFGVKDVAAEFYSGTITINELIEELESEEDFDAHIEKDTTIHEGSRNKTMFQYAVCILKKYGDTDETYEKFLERADQCETPLSDLELKTIWKSANKYYDNIKKQPGYIAPEIYNDTTPVWENPIPFDEFNLPVFPIETLPPFIREYVLGVAETTQTPVDMPATSALAIVAMCMQGKYRIQGKKDWIEPVNLYALNIAEPSERKSAVNAHMTRPVNQFEAQYNKVHAAEFETNKMRKRVLERRQKSVEDQVSKGKADEDELVKIATEVANFKEKFPMQSYVDDITPEKLVSVMADRNGVAAVISAEGGIFDQLAGGMYSKSVNIDVLLKGHAGDTIRVDRIGRNSESIEKPALTMLLSVQPNILSGMMQNSIFRGRGLTARFLYCFPASHVGDRKYRSQPIPDEVIREYDALINNLLDVDCNPSLETPEIITLSKEADMLLEEFANEIEPKLKGEYADIADWAGKLVGAVLRISAILWRASELRCEEFLQDEPDAEVNADIMYNAITIGRYYIEHARAAYSLMGADPVIKQCKYVLNAVKNAGLVEASKRDIMRLCRGFRNADELQPVLDRLTEYGYIAPKQDNLPKGKGRPGSKVYLINPCIYE